MKTRKMIKMAMVASALVLLSLNAWASIDLSTTFPTGVNDPRLSGNTAIFLARDTVPHSNNNTATVLADLNSVIDPDISNLYIAMYHNDVTNTNVITLPSVVSITGDILAITGSGYVEIFYGKGEDTNHLNHSGQWFFNLPTYGTYDFTALSLSGVHSQVPIPTAAWLLGTGLVGLVGARRKMKK
jgi:hypothetical protein